MAIQTAQDIAAQLFTTGGAPSEVSRTSSKPGTVGRTAGGLTLTPTEDRTKARAGWLGSLFDRLRLARGLAVPTDVEDYLLAELQRMDYTGEQAKAAELWVLYGDWTYKGKDARLELSDLVNPPQDQVARLAAARGMVILTQAEVRKREQVAYNAGKADQAREQHEAPPPDMVALCRELLDAKADLADLGERLVAEREQYEKKIVRLEKQLAKARTP